MSTRAPDVFPITLSPARDHTRPLELVTIRAQAAVVRALLDEVERTVPGSRAERGLAPQLVEDLARLGCRVFESAAAMAKALDAPPRKCTSDPGAGSRGVA
jgi:hypothetical protein